MAGNELSAAPVYRLAVTTAVALLVVLAAGAALNSLGGALSVPDWPLSYGKLLPINFVGSAAHEQSHRLVVGLTAVLMVFFCVRLWRHEERPWVRKLGLTAGALYFVQVLIGGVVVLALNPPWITVLHVLLAQLSFALVFLVVMASSKRWTEPGAEESRRLPRRLIVSVTHLALLQILLGALARHPPAGQTLFIVSLLVHLAVALALAVLIIVLSVLLVRRRSPRRLRFLGFTLLALILLQWAIGLPLFVISPEPLAEPLTPAPRGFSYLHVGHVLVAALLFAHAATLSLLAREREGDSGAPAPSSR